MPGFLAQLGMQAAGQATGAGMGLLLQRGQDKRQINMQRKLQRMEMEGTKEMTDYNFKKQMEMWEATNYKAQIDQLKKANLSPGLIYGGSGPGGAIANIDTGHVTGGQAPRGGGEALGMAIPMGQAALTAAQVENIKAQTENVKANTAKTSGVDTEEAKTRIASLTQGISNAKAIEELTKIQSSMASTQDHIMGKTQNAAIAMILTELRSATAAMDILERNNDIDAQTKQSKINQITAQAIGAGLANELTKAQTAATGQSIQESKIRVQQIHHQIHKWAAEIEQQWQSLDNEGKRIKVEQLKTKLQQESGYDWRGVRYEFTDNTIEMIDEILKKK